MFEKKPSFAQKSWFASIWSNKSLALHPKCLNKSLASFPKCLNNSLALHPNCLSKSLALHPKWLNKSRALHSMCLKKSCFAAQIFETKVLLCIQNVWTKVSVNFSSPKFFWMPNMLNKPLCVPYFLQAFSQCCPLPGSELVSNNWTLHHTLF